MRLDDLRRRVRGGALARTPREKPEWEDRPPEERWAPGKPRFVIAEGLADALRLSKSDPRSFAIALGIPVPGWIPLERGPAVAPRRYDDMDALAAAMGVSRPEVEDAFRALCDALKPSMDDMSKMIGAMFDAAKTAGKAIMDGMRAASIVVDELVDWSWLRRTFHDWPEPIPALAPASHDHPTIRQRFCARGRRRPNHGKDPLI